MIELIVKDSVNVTIEFGNLKNSDSAIELEKWKTEIVT